MLDKELLEVLCCPECRGEVKEQGDKIICQNSECGLQYPIKDGIPVMLVEEAKKGGK
jgi:uncharacterized protein YbaR (Trm112 family)